MTEATYRKHSPTPWKVEKNLYGTANIIETEGRQIAACARECPSADLDADAKQDEANAAYIVEAVNAHERLVAENARLREVLKWATSTIDVSPEVLDETEDWENEVVCWVLELQKKARAALGEESKDGND